MKNNKDSNNLDRLLFAIFLAVLIFLISAWAHVKYARLFGDSRTWWNSATAVLNAGFFSLLFLIFYSADSTEKLKQAINNNFKILSLPFTVW
ncbi:MAG: hypothetical protein ABH834_03810, partial [Candidatus Altiarchaeota archaeon]